MPYVKSKGWGEERETVRHVPEPDRGRPEAAWDRVVSLDVAPDFGGSGGVMFSWVSRSSEEYEMSVSLGEAKRLLEGLSIRGHHCCYCKMLSAPGHYEARSCFAVSELGEVRVTVQVDGAELRFGFGKDSWLIGRLADSVAEFGEAGRVDESVNARDLEAEPSRRGACIKASWSGGNAFFELSVEDAGRAVRFLSAGGRPAESFRCEVYAKAGCRLEGAAELVLSVKGSEALGRLDFEGGVGSCLVFFGDRLAVAMAGALARVGEGGRTGINNEKGEVAGTKRVMLFEEFCLAAGSWEKGEKRRSRE